MRFPVGGTLLGRRGGTGEEGFVSGLMKGWGGVSWCSGGGATLVAGEVEWTAGRVVLHRVSGARPLIPS
jgi:hypothetical protein